MKRYFRCFLYFFVFSLLFCDVVLAEECDVEDMARARVLAENVDVKYEYLGKKEKDDILSADLFHVTISGVVDGIEVGVSDDYTGDETIYGSANISNGTIEFDRGIGEIVIHVYYLNCNIKPLRTDRIKLYRKNSYALSEECNKLEKYNLDVCDENYQGDLDDAKFYEVVGSYLEDDPNTIEKVNQFVKVNLWLFILGGLLLLGLIIFLIYRYRRSSVLE